MSLCPSSPYAHGMRCPLAPHCLPVPESRQEPRRLPSCLGLLPQSLSYIQYTTGGGTSAVLREKNFRVDKNRLPIFVTSARKSYAHLAVCCVLFAATLFANVLFTEFIEFVIADNCNRLNVSSNFLTVSYDYPVRPIRV